MPKKYDHLPAEKNDICNKLKTTFYKWINCTTKE